MGVGEHSELGTELGTTRETDTISYSSPSSSPERTLMDGFVSNSFISSTSGSSTSGKGYTGGYVAESNRIERVERSIRSVEESSIRSVEESSFSGLSGGSSTFIESGTEGSGGREVEKGRERKREVRGEEERGEVRGGRER